jgi:coenzyme F420-reducing hydrogenase beta subunit
VEVKEGCLPKCSLCLKTCPFWTREENESTLAASHYGHVPGIERRPETGYYLDCYSGYSKVHGHRANGSSGGLATWFLEKLLEQQIVDRVACVTPSGIADKLFNFAVFDNVEDIRRSARSCYYPVELGAVIREIVAKEGRYAITGLPCFLKAVRLAASHSRRLRERIVVLVGLVCGQTKSKSFVEYATALAGGDPNRLAGVRFRIKDPQRPATDLGLRLEHEAPEGGRRASTVFWSEGIGRAWRNGYFRLNACNYCDDVFAEVADVALMDAWLPGFQEDYRGHSLVLNRNPQFKSLWDDELRNGSAKIDRIDVSQVVRSQRAQLSDKREAMQYRSFLAQRESKVYPHKRWPPDDGSNLLQRRLWRLRLRAGHVSREIWAESKDLESVRSALRWTAMQLSLLTPLYWGLGAIREGRWRDPWRAFVGRGPPRSSTSDKGVGASI